MGKELLGNLYHCIVKYTIRQPIHLTFLQKRLCEFLFCLLFHFHLERGQGSSGGGVCCNGGSVDGWCGGVKVCVGDGAGGGGLAMVAVDVGGVVAEEVVVVVPVDGGGMLCVVLVLFLSGV